MPRLTVEMLPANEADLVQRAIARDEAAVRAIIRLHNRRLFRIARGITRDDGEAEDVLQDAYLRAFTSLGGFRGESRLGTWLGRIVVNEALQRLRRRVEEPVGDAASQFETLSGNVIPFPLSENAAVDPERAVAQRQITRLLERAIDGLPDEFRAVLVARVLEDMSIKETAEFLGLKPETVKTRLFRARRLLKLALRDHLDPLLGDVFPFAGARCDRLTEAVIGRLREIGGRREPF